MSGPVRNERKALVALLRSVLVSAALVAAYFVLPLRAVSDARTGAFLGLGLVVVISLLGWEVRSITQSDYPVARGVGAVAVTIPLFFVVFATTYYTMCQVDPAGWSEPLSRLDALYFTVTVFATVGFGDIVATSELSRGVVLGQMVLNLVLLGVITRVVVQAIELGLRRRRGEVVTPPTRTE